MDAEDDRDALLFDLQSSQHSLISNAGPSEWRNVVPANARLFPEQGPPTPVPAAYQSSLTDDAATKSGALPQRPPENLLAHSRRLVTLFAPVDVTPPRKNTLPGHTALTPFLAASEQRTPSHLTSKPLFMRHLPSLGSLVGGMPSSLPGNATLAASTQRVILRTKASREPCPTERVQPPLLGNLNNTAAPAHQPSFLASSPFAPCGADNKPEELGNSLKAVEGHLKSNGMGDSAAHKFVVQELQEEAEAAVAASRALTALRQHAQHLLNEAAEKLERVAVQQRKRAEAAADEAAAILRRAMEAQCTLRHERSLLEQKQRQRCQDQQLKLTTLTEALEAERRRCVELEVRLETVQQENRQLRALLHAHLSSAHRTDSSSQLAPAGAVSARMRHSVACRRSATALHTARSCPLRAASFSGLVAPAAPAKTFSARGGCVAGATGWPASSQPQRNHLAEQGLRRAILDVEVSLPRVSVAEATLQSPAKEAPAHEEAKPTPPGEGGRCQTQAPAHQDSIRRDRSAAPTSESCSSKACQASCGVRHHKRSNRSVRRNVYETDSSTDSSSNSSMEERRRDNRGRWGQRRRGHSCRSLSRGSVSTSTSNSSEVLQRQVNRHQCQRRSSRRASSARPQHISFSVPELDIKRPTLCKVDSSSAGATPKHGSRGANKLTLRKDVAGRLQASLTRLQERQALQGKIQNLAKQLLHPSRGAAMS
ncbi:hypothetical protein cyc_05465 [Cyclospora cayetanensis]|uniref:Uncharacterized protein n=1 Tax=Cyclospora cayetanensis TaxID=88456 RepID=A0A1D3DB64_9EIME|nr:hypothetical protein cyc_05465 [Cyclospora cayetanensis]